MVYDESKYMGILLERKLCFNLDEQSIAELWSSESQHNISPASSTVSDVY